jgi:hypothetical protein
MCRSAPVPSAEFEAKNKEETYRNHHQGRARDYRQGRPYFVPPAERVAGSDQDGNLAHPQIKWARRTPR